MILKSNEIESNTTGHESWILSLVFDSPCIFCNWSWSLTRLCPSSKISMGLWLKTFPLFKASFNLVGKLAFLTQLLLPSDNLKEKRLGNTQSCYMIIKFVNSCILRETPDFGATFTVSSLQVGISQIIDANNAFSGETQLSKKSDIKYHVLLKVFYT